MTENLAHSLPHNEEEVNNEASEIAYQVVEACSEARGKDVTVLNMTQVSDLATYFIVVSGRSDRQVQGIANRVLDTLVTQGKRPISCEGLDRGHWVVVDWGDVVLHVFFDPVRTHYGLENLWKKAPRVTLRQKRRPRAKARNA